MPATVHLSRLTPLSFLERSATAFPDRLAVVDGDRRLTWIQVGIGGLGQTGHGAPQTPARVVHRARRQPPVR